MPNYLDLPREDADAILRLKKHSPKTDFRAVVMGANERWELVTGVVLAGGLYRKSMTVELLCHRSSRPLRESFKFSLLLFEHGRNRRAYQLDTTSAPLVSEGEHDWPHQHIGRDRLTFGMDYPANFSSSIAYFCTATNLRFEEKIESPFDFKLRPS